MIPSTLERLRALLITSASFSVRSLSTFRKSSGDSKSEELRRGSSSSKFYANCSSIAMAKSKKARYPRARLRTLCSF